MFGTILQSNLTIDNVVQVNTGSGVSIIGTLKNICEDDGLLVIDEESNVGTRRYVLNMNNVESISQLIKRKEGMYL